MKDKSKVTAIILVIVTIIVVFVSNFILKNKEGNEEKINIVTNYSNFYTVNSCLYRTITYASSNDIDSLFLTLNDKYKKDNKITEENVLELFKDVESDSTFVSEKMYYTEINKNLLKYYVEGSIERNQISDDADTNKLESKKVYFIVYMDSKNKIFSIEPYDGQVFIEGDNYEK